MADLRTFARRIRRLAGRTAKNVNQTVIRTAIAVDQAVVLATPVDTGRARGGWQAAIDSPIRDQIERLDLGGSETISANNSVIKTRRLGQEVFISNNVRYIEFLNEGSSAQAPAGFIEMAVQAAATVVARARVVK